MKIFICTFILFSFVTTLVNSQERCKKIKSAIYSETKYNPFNNIASFRLGHSENPKIDICKKMHFQSVLFFNKEYIENKEINNNISTINVYSSHRINYNIASNFEFNATLHELIVYSGDEIQEYGGQNPYSRFSIGIKYSLVRSKNCFAIHGQLALPKKEINEKITSEIKFLYSRDLIQNLCFTANFGGLFFSKDATFLIYSIECKYLIRNKIEIIVEHHRNFSHYTIHGNPVNNILSGVGIYSSKSFYFYLTFEKGVNSLKSTNIGKFDVGINYCF